MRDQVKEVLVEFSQTTTISGLYFINKYQSTLSRLLWVVISLLLLMLCTWQCAASFSNYFARPTVVKTRMTTKELIFPAVTFCSTNPYMASKIFKSEKVKNLLQIIDKNAARIKVEVDTDSGKTFERVKRQAEFTTPQSSNTVEDSMDENCYDVSDLEGLTVSSSDSIKSSTTASVGLTLPPSTAGSLNAQQTFSDFATSALKSDTAKPSVDNVDSSTIKTYDQEDEYEDGENCTADDSETTSGPNSTTGLADSSTNLLGTNTSFAPTTSKISQILTEKLPNPLSSTLATKQPDSFSPAYADVQTTYTNDSGRLTTDMNQHQSDDPNDYSEDDYEDDCVPTTENTDSPTDFFSREESSTWPSTTVSPLKDGGLSNDLELGYDSTSAIVIPAATTAVIEREISDNPQQSKKADISMKSETELWDSFFVEEATKNNKLAYEVTAQEALLYVTQTESQDVLSNMSYELSDIFVAGLFNGKKLAMSKFKKVHYAGVGNCFTFNNDEPYHLNRQAGRQRGLELELHLKQKEFLSQSLSPGFLFLIHSQEEPIFPDSDSMKISPDFQTEIALLYEQIILPSSPYTNCLKPSRSYSDSICFRKCQQRWVVKNCGCADPSLPNIENATYGYCFFGNHSCVEQARITGADSTKTNCDCPLPCLTRHYKSIMTISRRRLTERDSITDASGKHKADPKMSSNRTANVDVFFRTLNQITYERVPSYEMNALISDLAQYLGLWLGFSAITFFELIPFGYYVTRATVNRKKI